MRGRPLLPAARVRVGAELRAVEPAPLGGIAPTGKTVSTTNMVFMRLEDGLIVERWAESDDLALLEQLGVAQPKEATAA